MVFAESGLELSHGGGPWFEALFLPEAKVAAMHVYDVEMRLEPELTFVDRVRLFAYPSEKPQNDLTGVSGEPSPVEKIEISADFAKEIVALAELTANQQAETSTTVLQTGDRREGRRRPAASLPPGARVRVCGADRAGGRACDRSGGRRRGWWSSLAADIFEAASEQFVHGPDVIREALAHEGSRG